MKWLARPGAFGVPGTYGLLLVMFGVIAAHAGESPAVWTEAPIVAASAASAPEPTAASEGEWSELMVGARQKHVAVVDPVRNRLVVFGGISGVKRSDVSVLSLEEPDGWTTLHPAGATPPTLLQASAVYDPIRDRMLVFGGGDGTNQYHDVWALSLGDSCAWTLLHPGGDAPNARYAHGAVYDPVRDRMIVFGGVSSFSSMFPTPSIYYNDVWALSLSDSVFWTALTPTGTAPSARINHVTVYDSARDRVLVFGGAITTNDLTGLNDVWALRLSGTSAWSPITPTGPAAATRVSAAGIYDPVRDALVVFGGWTPTGAANDTWRLSFQGTPTWSAVSVSGSGIPPVRTEHVAVFDAASDRMLVFGGLRDTGLGLNDTWSLTLGSPQQWTELTRAFDPPSPRYGASMVFDPTRDRMVVYGGAGNQGLYDARPWALSFANGPAWASIQPAGAVPVARQYQGMVLQSTRDRLVVFGGQGPGGVKGDVWALPLSGDSSWTRVETSGPSPAPRYGHSTIYDPKRDRLVIFGGYDSGPSLLNDVWALSLGAVPTWQQLGPFPVSPSARSWHHAVYDPYGDRMLVFGGQSTDCQKVWLLSFSGTPTWTSITPAGTYAGCGSSFEVDPVRHRLVLVGQGASGGTPGPYWVLDLEQLDPAASPAWVPLDAGIAWQGGRGQAAMAYDSRRDRMVVFSGVGVDNGCNDTWALTWGQPESLTVTCPSEIPWTPGGINTIEYHVDNPFGFEQPIDYQLTSERAWPGFPVRGTALADAAGGGTISIAVSIPDTAEVGLNELGLRVMGATVPQLAACSHHLHDETTPVECSLVATLVDPGFVRITWHVASAAARPFSVQRAGGSGEWIDYGTSVTDAGQMLVFEDHDVEAGARYGYRVVFGEPGSSHVAGEVWVDVPRKALLGLAGARPNPATFAPSVEFSLPDALPATLEVFDLAGRRWASVAVGALGPGHHRVDLSRVRAFAPGVYLIRLTHATQRIESRAVVIR